MFVKETLVIRALICVLVTEITKNSSCQVFLSALWLPLHECWAL